MSEISKRPVWQTVLISLVLTAVLSCATYYAWTYTNTGVRKLPRGIEVFALLKDLRFFSGFLAVFAVLTIAHQLIGFVAGKLSKKD